MKKTLFILALLISFKAVAQTPVAANTATTTTTYPAGKTVRNSIFLYATYNIVDTTTLGVVGNFEIRLYDSQVDSTATHGGYILQQIYRARGVTPLPTLGRCDTIAAFYKQK
jgi:hypothetical protein